MIKGKLIVGTIILLLFFLPNLTCSKSNYIKNIDLRTIQKNTMILPSVRVHIVWMGRRIGSGSGVIFHYNKVSWNTEHDLFILTAYHVIKMMAEKNELDCSLSVDVWDKYGGFDTHKAIFIKGNEKDDIALIKVHREKDSIKRGNLLPLASKINIFDEVFVVSSQLGRPPVATDGIIARFDPDWTVISAPVIFGSSGGPVYLASTGEIIGIVSSVMVVNMKGNITPLSSYVNIIPIKKIYSLIY